MIEDSIEISVQKLAIKDIFRAISILHRIASTGYTYTGKMGIWVFFRVPLYYR